MSGTQEQKTYDLAVIGGGIAGAGIARDAALRGLSVILFEKNTFGSGTSSTSSKLIHGGLRYLETAWSELKRGHIGQALKNFRFVRHALRETHILHRNAPELVKPIRLLLPVYRESKRNRVAVYFGCWLYGMLSRLGGAPRGSQILDSPEKVLALVPSLKKEGLVGGAVVWDHTTDDTALVRATIASAVKAGANALEHCAVTAFDKEGPGYTLETAHGRYRSKRLVNATGPWVDRTKYLGGELSRELIVPVAGAHIEFKKFAELSVILEAPDKRIFFVVDRGDRSRVGTTERAFADPDAVRATDAEIEYLLGAARHYFPGADLVKERILSSDAGIRPLVKPKKEKAAHQISREHEFVMGKGAVVHVLGVKLTDHRRAAEELVSALFPGTRCRTAREKL